MHGKVEAVENPKVQGYSTIIALILYQVFVLFNTQQGIYKLDAVVSFFFFFFETRKLRPKRLSDYFKVIYI